MQKKQLRELDVRQEVTIFTTIISNKYGFTRQYRRLAT